MIEYIRESISKLSKQNLRLHDKPVYIIKAFNNDINFDSILQRIESLVPIHLTDEFEGIYVGNFNDFHKKSRSFNAMYKDGSIYVSNEQDDDDDLIDDVVHEIAHAIENSSDLNDIIYGDHNLESEFLAKRRTLYHLLDKDTCNMLYYTNPDYNSEFDKHLYKDLGYDYLRNIASGLFYSPYAITSLKEYWANGFENYLLGDRQRLKDLSPVLYNKIEHVLNTDKEDLYYGS